MAGWVCSKITVVVVEAYINKELFMGASLIIGVVFSLLGFLLVAIGVFILIRTRAFISRSQETKGTVINLLTSHGSEGGITYAPVFRFTTIQGQVMEVAESVYSNPPGFSVGQIVDILYDPQDPSNARAKKWSSLYFVPLLLGGMGAIFGGVGVVLLVVQIIEFITRHR
jgi:hypothetical protein